MLDAAVDGSFKALYIQGEDILQSDPDTTHVSAGLAAMECVVVHDLFLNETANYAHVFLPGSTFLEKDGTFTNAERRINRVRPAMAPKTGRHEWQIICQIARAMGHDMAFDHPSQIMAEIAATTPDFAGVTYELIDRLGSVQWPCNADAPAGTPIMHVDRFVRGKGRFITTGFTPTTEQVSEAFPLILTTGRILSQYNAGGMTRRTDNVVWYGEDLLEMHPQDAARRGVATGEQVVLSSRIGRTLIKVKVSERLPAGVVYSTFHFRETGTNVVTTDNADWATSCPEFKVTAVQVAHV
jgi:formate dehydrogenase major subunit